ncbi:MAG: hypothetical protein ACRDD1_05265, partial [Planctomycetia bacterium]
TADLAYYFLAAAHRRTVADGAVGLVLPRAVLTAPAAGRLRRRLTLERPPASILAPTDPFLFPGANVFVAAVTLRRSAGAPCRFRRTIDEPGATAAVGDENWWRPMVEGSLAVDASSVAAFGSTLGDAFEIFARMTTAMAYLAAEHVVEDEEGVEGGRLATTGLIDLGGCAWGRRRCRYLGRDFERPIVAASPTLPTVLASRLARVRRPKVVVAGLGKRLEAFLDADGVYCGAVSTFTIVHPRDDLSRLSAACELLNAPAATHRLHAELGANAMGGGSITVSKHFLRMLPWKTVD